MEITGIENGKIFVENGKQLYAVTENRYGLVTLDCLGSNEGSTGCGEKEKESVDWTPEDWRKFFSCYLVAKNKQLSGKLHSIIESFGGTEQEVKARKSVAFQLLELK